MIENILDSVSIDNGTYMEKKMKKIKWYGIDIPDRDCFEEDKKCTPFCSFYDLGWLTLDEEK